jgi:hypothetical protein
MPVQIGGVQAAVSDGVLTSSIKEPARAEFTLSASQVASLPVDFFAPVEVTIDGTLVHSGSITSVTPTSGTVAVQCQSGTGMTENLLGALVSQNVPVQDLVYAAAREGGFDDDHISIHELDTLPIEPIEVVVGLSDIAITEPYRIGPIWVLPAGAAAPAVDDFHPRPDLLDEVAAAPAYAVGVATRQTMFAGEQAALADIDVALAWLVARAHYGFVRTPAGRANDFDRLGARVNPTRDSMLIVRGLLTGRRWVRRPGSRLQRQAVKLDDSPIMAPPLSGHLSQSERLVLLAARRAIVGDDPIERTQALWEAFELYAGKVSVPETFSKSDLDKARDTLPEEFSDAQRRRLREVIGMANQPSLMLRLLTALSADRVPLTPEEEAMLKRLRKVRNDVAHGRDARAPSSDDLDWGCSVLSRALVFRADRRMSASRCVAVPSRD